MSQLTSEEREFVEQIREDIQNLPTPQTSHTAILKMFIEFVDRLSARVEELGREKSCWCDEMGDEPCPLHARENALQDRALFAEANLSDLLSAVEPIEARYQREYEDMHDNDPALVSVKDLRTLSTVAAGIREGKG